MRVLNVCGCMSQQLGHVCGASQSSYTIFAAPSGQLGAAARRRAMAHTNGRPSPTGERAPRAPVEAALASDGVARFVMTDEEYRPVAPLQADASRFACKTCGVNILLKVNAARHFTKTMVHRGLDPAAVKQWLVVKDGNAWVSDHGQTGNGHNKIYDRISRCNVPGGAGSASNGGVRSVASSQVSAGAGAAPMPAADTSHAPPPNVVHTGGDEACRREMGGMPGTSAPSCGDTNDCDSADYDGMMGGRDAPAASGSTESPHGASRAARRAGKPCPNS